MCFVIWNVYISRIDHAIAACETHSLQHTDGLYNLWIDIDVFIALNAWMSTDQPEDVKWSQSHQKPYFQWSLLCQYE